MMIQERGQWTIKVYYTSLLGACFRLDSEKFQDLAKDFISTSEKVLKGEKNEL